MPVRQCGKNKIFFFTPHSSAMQKSFAYQHKVQAVKTHIFRGAKRKGSGGYHANANGESLKCTIL